MLRFNVFIRSSVFTELRFTFLSLIYIFLSLCIFSNQGMILYVSCTLNLYFVWFFVCVKLMQFSYFNSLFVGPVDKQISSVLVVVVNQSVNISISQLVKESANHSFRNQPLNQSAKPFFSHKGFITRTQTRVRVAVVQCRVGNAGAEGTTRGKRLRGEVCMWLTGW